MSAIVATATPSPTKNDSSAPGMSASTIAIIKATAGVVAPHAREITNLFYKTMFANSPEAAQFFNIANQTEGRQPQALANAIIAYASNIDNLGVLGPAIELMATKHVGLQVLPQHYSIVHDNLMIAVGQVLGAAITPEIGAAWSEAVMFLAGVLIDAEEVLYKKAESRRGGWRGWRSFQVTNIEQVADNVKTFTFTRSNSHPSTEDFEFVPGEYLTIRVDLNGKGALSTPRHYTITSKPNTSTFQITTKRVPGGVVSGYMHDTLRVGMSVDLSPPIGPFHLNPAAPAAVLISAGIGMTPMKSFLDALGGNCVKAIHFDHNRQCVPFYQYFEEFNAGKNHFYFSNTCGHCDLSTYLAPIIAEVGSNHEFYLCGPSSFMQQTAHALVNAGVDKNNIKWEAFSPQLSCPV